VHVVGGCTGTTISAAAAALTAVAAPRGRCRRRAHTSRTASPRSSPPASTRPTTYCRAVFAQFAYCRRARIIQSHSSDGVNMHADGLLLHTSEPKNVPGVELGRYRFFKSVSVSVPVFQNIVISVSVFGLSARTYRCVSNNTITDTLRPPLSPEWGLGPRITNCGHKR